MTPGKLTLSISIVSHGQLDLARQAIESLALFVPRVPMEILLTENLRGKVGAGVDWPLPVHVYENPKPRGLAANQNAAVRRSHGKYVCLLNPDVVFVEEVFGSLLDLLNGGAHLVAPTIQDTQGEIQDSGREVPSPWVLVQRRLAWSEAVGRPRPGEAPDWIAGTFLLSRVEDFHRLGGMNEGYRLYFEDVDFGCRATLAGMRLSVDPRVRLVHEARRASAHNARYFLQHSFSAMRFFLSPVYRDIRAQKKSRFPRSPSQATTFPPISRNAAARAEPTLADIPRPSLPVRTRAIRILLFANTDWYLFRFCLPLAQTLREKGIEVIFLSPAGRYVVRLQAEGFHWRSIGLSRLGWNPLTELMSIRRIQQTYRELLPDLVNHFTSKPVIYGSLAARSVPHVAQVNTIPGLGYSFVSSSWYSPWVRRVALAAYRIAFSTGPARVIVQNPDDATLLVRNRCAPAAAIRVVRGSGVDVERFAFSPEPDGVPIVLMAGRMLQQKGVYEFVQAARMLRAQGQRARFVLVGDPDPGNPASVSETRLRSWHDAGEIEWWGWREDMETVLAESHLVVLPSYGGEGLPSILLEGASVGRALIATDVAGSREIVRHGVNGLLVPPRDAVSLSGAIDHCLSDPAGRAKMGAAGRQLVLEQFTQAAVDRQTLAVYAELIDGLDPSPG